MDSVVHEMNIVRRRWRNFRSCVIQRLPARLRGRGDTLHQDHDQDKEDKEAERIPLLTLLERVVDDDRLDDRCWRAEMREVELWENERFVGTGGEYNLIHNLYLYTCLTSSFSRPHTPPEKTLSFGR